MIIATEIKINKLIKIKVDGFYLQWEGQLHVNWHVKLRVNFLHVFHHSFLRSEFAFGILYNVVAQPVLIGHFKIA